MSTDTDVGQFAQRARELLLESIDHTDARIRSRLNRSRQAAVAAAALDGRDGRDGRVRSAWLRWTLLPATGAACAAALVMVFMLHTAPVPVAPKPLDNPNSLDMIDLVTDDDALGLVENGDNGFYEWAAAQDGAGGVGGGA